MNIRNERARRIRDLLMSKVCIACGAKIGMPCVALSGLIRPVQFFHMDRYRALPAFGTSNFYFDNLIWSKNDEA